MGRTVGWEKRSDTDIPFLLNLIKKFECKNVLDVALGTGFHSIELLKKGLLVKSIDVSPAMITVAKRNAAQYSVALDAKYRDWETDRKSVV